MHTAQRAGVSPSSTNLLLSESLLDDPVDRPMSETINGTLLHFCQRDAVVALFRINDKRGKMEMPQSIIRHFRVR